MFDNYSEMKFLSRPIYDDLPSMPRRDRAAQFAPFAALTGYDDAVDEEARRTDSRRELTEDEINELNARLNELSDTLSDRPDVELTYFLPDPRKSGGSYVTKRGAVRIIDRCENVLVFTDGARIPIVELCTLKFADKKKSERS